MKIDKIYPETLKQLMLEVLIISPEFSYLSGTQPFLMKFMGKEYYVYVKNLSSAYFKDRPDTTRAQLPIREEFEEIRKSANLFVFLGYDQKNDVLVCWNFHNVKMRLNERRSVSFYSRQYFQDEVSLGVFSRKQLKNGDEPILFKRRDLVEFFLQIDSFFPLSLDSDKFTSLTTLNENLHNVSTGKLLKITNKELIEELQDLVKAKRTLQALKLAADFYGEQFPMMTLADWSKLIKELPK